jgi:ring-1,2-phenylacetyl-CoA epoxidase subunit PaaC
MENPTSNLLNYTLQLADNALINGHRLSEWCGHGPVLEQDIAITNIALDHLGQARSLYQYAAEQINKMPSAEKQTLFASTALQEKMKTGAALDEDDLAYLRDSWDFKNVLLVEQPNTDWAYTVIRSFFFDVYNLNLFTQLKNSNDATLAAVAEKSLKEVEYHVRWSSEWMIRLGDGTEESNKRLQTALNERWMFTGELFNASNADTAMQSAGCGAALEAIHSSWQKYVEQIAQEACLKIPENNWMQQGGKQGTHSEHLGYVLAELQFMQRAYPGMKW